nr:uncharacterized protein LOC112007050 isoform X4 [Quercus suber]
MSDYLPDEVLLEILQRLSVKSVIQLSNCCAIWVMKEYGVVDSWTKLFTIDLKQEIIWVLCLQKNGNILVEAKLPNDWELSSYDPKSQHVKNLGICWRPHYFHVDNYVENLVLLDKLNDAVSKRGACRKRQCSLEAKRMGHQAL